MIHATNIRMKTVLSVTTGLALAFTATAENIVEKLAGRPEFSTLVTAVTEAGLVDTLASADDITILAPTNDAFADIPEEDLTALLADKDALTRVLTYHVLPKNIRFRSFKSGPLPTLLPDSTVEVEVRSFFWGWYRTVRIDEASITRADLRADNGVIHRINKVLDPGYEPLPSILEIAANNPDFSILTSLVSQAGFAQALGSDRSNFTVFAPTNAAFKALGDETLEAVQNDRSLLREILKNHLAKGALESGNLVEAGSVRTLLRLELPLSEDAESPTGFAVGGLPLAVVDIPARNGIVHVVGGVLLPPTPQSLVDVASGREDLSTLVTALGAAELASVFDSTKKWPAYTIFAPNNAAFESLPDGALDSLLADPTGALADTLKLHVVAGRIEAAHLSDGQVLHSLSGDRLNVRIEDGTVSINGSPVAEADLKAENGVIHVIGSVIEREAFTVADLVASKSYLSTLLAALDAAKLTSAVDDPDAELTVFAPIDRAFAALPDGTLEALLADPEGDLKNILLYHVSAGAQSASDLLDSGSAETLLGPELEITSQKLRFWWWRTPYRIVRVNGVRVLASDLQTDNGVVHLLYGVLLPPNE